MITVKRLIEELNKCDPDKEVSVRNLYKKGYGSRSEEEVFKESKPVDSLEEFDGRVLLWLDDRKPNQCDGCLAGYPIENGIHRVPYPSGSMVCQSKKY